MTKHTPTPQNTSLRKQPFQANINNQTPKGVKKSTVNWEVFFVFRKLFSQSSVGTTYQRGTMQTVTAETRKTTGNYQRVQQIITK